jgi:XTP/dITP diphosphohydrolase
MTATLLLATISLRKRREFVVNLRRLDAKLVMPTDLGLHAVPARNGATYRENAELVAAAYCRLSGLMTLAEDSGLEVEALGGQPGLATFNFAPGTRPTDAENQAYLLKLLADKPRPWTARMRSSVVIADPTWGPMRYHSFEGEAHGEIAPEPRGLYGFGFDALFLIPEMSRTLAELEEADRYRFSARSQALLAASKLLEDIL